jgi:hypothetical protein
MTTNRLVTARDQYNSGDPQAVALAAQKTDLGNQLSKVKVTFTGLTSAAAQDITTAAAKAAAAISGISLLPGENLPPIGSVVALRVTAGAAAAGVRTIGDTAATAAATVTRLSDDGKTLTFEAAVTAFVLVYYPAPTGGADQSLPYGAP